MTEKERMGEELIRELPTGLLRWYPFMKGSRAAYIGSKDDAIAGMLKESKGLITEVFDLKTLGEAAGQGAYAYVICIEWLEHEKEPEKTLKILASMLAPDGILLLGMNNRLGMRYFCGDKDPYIGHIFAGIENYCGMRSKPSGEYNGRMYSRAEIHRMLDASGLTSRRTYSVLTDLNNPTFIIADGYIPNEDLTNRVFPTYNDPDTVFLDERRLYGSLLDNGMFHSMANAYLMECGPKDRLSDALYVTSSVERGRDDALITVIHEDHTVTKAAAYPEGRRKLEGLIENSEKLRKRGISTVDAKLSDSIYTMPFIEAPNGQAYLRELLKKDKKEFLKAMDHFHELIVQSSEIYNGKYLNKNNEQSSQKSTDVTLMEEAMFDMVPLNSFYVNGEFVFYDQEFCIRDYPLNVLVTRMIVTFLMNAPELEKLCPREELFERYGISDGALWHRMEGEFLKGLRKQDELSAYHMRVREDPVITGDNRLRMNYSSEGYKRIFINIFDTADTKKLILFGSGAYAERFIALYSGAYPVFAVVDNAKDRWGRELEGQRGVKVQSPDMLKEMELGVYKVMVCIRDFKPVLEQLDKMGISDYSVYDGRSEYTIIKKKD